MSKVTLHIIIVVISGLILGCAQTTRAQLNPSQTMYFQNRYMYNPAMAGIDEGLNLNLGYKQQWSNFPGMPRTSTFTSDYQMQKVGIGLNVADYKEGLIRSTRVMGTYAYHLPVGADEKLSFGLSLGVNDSRVDNGELTGDAGDAEVAQYNQLKPYVDGDFGIAYTSDNLYIGAALPNMKSIFFKSSDTRFDADRLLFMASISYKMDLSNEARATLLEPLVAYRIVNGYNNIIDGGVNLTLANYGLSMQALYHSSKAVGLGVGFDQRAYGLNLSYNMASGNLNDYSLGGFELGLRIKVF
ncbi:PorP/SprF family type IX secretion system membrane protein [Mucilaginibacter sp. dw_454]|uniref:PorP/SprF family type IX secretion system membrane protein n=1 Tax=Mucilaginibacter sp. dw_454 TaxID=2720079 RepID=UPI001BD60C54|nr:PorP/SprF family type IX secretion system membrane protein [Mucilaginibacter sp. dw_454]